MNNKSKHTPGPWKVGNEFSHHQDEIESADGRCIAIAWTRRPNAPGASARACFKDDPEGKANARLIASAPELLDVAVVAFTMTERYIQDLESEGIDDSCASMMAAKDVLKRISAAIDKATAN